MLALLSLLSCVPPEYDRALVAQLDAEVLALQERNEALRQQVGTCADETAPLPVYTELVQVFKGTKVRVDRQGQLAVLVVPGNEMFAPGSSVVREESAMILDMLSTALNLHPDLHVWVTGHTSNRELSKTEQRKYYSHWGLSMAQATGFMSALVANYGVAEDRFTVGGRGAMAPIAGNDTPEGQALNHRLVIAIGPPEDFR